LFGFDRINSADELAVWREQTGCFDRQTPTEYPVLAYQEKAGDETPYAVFYTEADIERLLEAIRRPVFRKPNAGVVPRRNDVGTSPLLGLPGSGGDNAT